MDGHLFTHGREALKDEAGAVAIIAALTLTVLLLFSAFVIDLGGLRADRAVGQSVSDMAAAAAIQEYDPNDPASARRACLEAISYAEANLGGSQGSLVAAAGADCATVFPETFSCAAATPVTAVYEGANKSVEVTIPVPDGSPLMQGLSHSTSEGRSLDGDPCERVGVRVSQDRDYFLATVAGFDGGRTSMGTVTRYNPGDEDGQFASLIVLAKEGCGTLQVTGQGNVEVEGFDGVDEDGAPEYFPGIITVDSLSDSCGSNKPVIHSNNDNAKIIAEDLLYSYALEAGDPQPQVYDQSKTPEIISPRPEAGPRIRRSPVDYSVNCLVDGDGEGREYPTGPRWSPNHPNSLATTWEIEPCDPDDDRSGGSYIEPLWLALQDLGSPDNSTADADTVDGLNDAGWSVFPDDFPGASCRGSDASGVYGPDDDHTADTDGDRFYINCPGGTGGRFKPDDIAFQGVATIVHRNGAALGNNEEWAVTGGTDTGTVIYFQRGALNFSGGGELRWNDVFVYFDSEDGRANLTGNGGTVEWRAAIDKDCEESLHPTAGCFAPLALWTNLYTRDNQTDNNMGGGANIALVGSFFGPNATFDMNGGTGFELDQAQFFAARLENSGQGALQMVTSPTTSFEILIEERRMIR